MIIATSITASYLERSQPFFTSVCQYMPTHNKAGVPNRRICFTIGFTTTIEGWECIQTEPSECKWQPTNRENFATLQHGEFVKYLPEDIEPDEMLLFIDSDMVLQREFDLEFPSMKGILVTACSYPQLPLRQVVKNLKGKTGTVRQFDIRKEYTEFCAAFIIATVARWEDIYRASRGLYPLLDNFKHHAAWQLLVNLAVLRNFRAFLLPSHICNAPWYEGTGMMADGTIFVERKYSEDNGNERAGDPASRSNGSTGNTTTTVQTSMEVETVYFNHTKFNEG